MDSLDENNSWWKNGIVYQVYPRSFSDSNGDGIGDIRGITSRLDYLLNLGVDAIWINPWYESPLADGGYDVADYREICSVYGTMDDAIELIDQAHERGIRVISDMVPNHTSVDHRWFTEALAAGPGSEARSRYHFRDSTDGGPPNNWTSVFGGPAWTQVPDGQWYLRIFDTSQPDLNWDHPEVRAEFLDVLRFWLDKGIDGFRIDVAHGLVKDPDYPDIHETPGQLLTASKLEGHPFWDQDGIHEIVREWRELIDSYPNRMLVAEAWVPDAQRLALYLRPDEYHQAFNFDFLEADWDPDIWRRLVTEALDSLASSGSTPTWVLSNHDVVRHPTRYGLPNEVDWRSWLLDGPHDALDAELGHRRAMAATMFILALPGSAYLYQGEELGLPEVWDLPLDVLDDPVWERSSHRVKGRDGCRVPIPWSDTGESFGFSDGPAWLPMPEHFASLSAQAQEAKETSTLSFYRKLISLRRKFFVSGGPLTWEKGLPPGVIGFRRSNGSTVWLNMGTEFATIATDATVMLNSDRADGERLLKPSAAVWFH